MNFDAVLIAGPTASGKSAAALALAERLNGLVINADSMQVYAEAPVLTAQPDAAVRARAASCFTVIMFRRANFIRWAAMPRMRKAALAEAKTLGKLPIFVGGTVACISWRWKRGSLPFLSISADLREAARALLAEIGVAALHEKLAARDPKTAAGLRPSDPQRVLRAWEVLEATGRPLAEWQCAPAESILKRMRVARLVLFLDPERQALRAAIAARFEAMVDAGGLAEARALEGLDPSLPAAKLLGLASRLQALAAVGRTR